MAIERVGEMTQDLYANSLVFVQRFAELISANPVFSALIATAAATTLGGIAIVRDIRRADRILSEALNPTTTTRRIRSTTEIVAERDRLEGVRGRNRMGVE